MAQQLVLAATTITAGAIGLQAFDKKFKLSTDLRLLRALLTLNAGVKRMEANNFGVADLVENVVDRHPRKSAIEFVNDGSMWTFADVDNGAPLPVFESA